MDAFTPSVFIKLGVGIILLIFGLACRSERGRQRMANNKKIIAIIAVAITVVGSVIVFITTQP